MAIELKTIGIIVADMGKTLQFYRSLGLSIPEVAADEDNYDVELSNGVTLGFLTLAMAQQADPNFVIPVGQGMNLQFLCESAA
ncbi:MAG: glyoxalase, partial [Bacteroidota bacterium]|uniref:hypothetical protein n=1 Tax=Runella sp. TaxID=1960881 RepID=UPI003016AE5B